jgi:putative GTP pyrophosphokinase
MPDRDIVLVRADTSEDVRLAFKNYFSDARDFIGLVEDGCARLSRAGDPARARRGRKVPTT